MSLARRSIRTSVFAALAASSLLLTGCSGAQSVSAACDAVVDDFNKMVDTVAGAKFEDAKSAEKTVAEMTAYETSLQEASDRVTNDEVKPKVDAVITALKTVNTGLPAWVSMTNELNELEKAAKKPGATGEEVAAYNTKIDEYDELKTSYDDNDAALSAAYDELRTTCNAA